MTTEIRILDESLELEELTSTVDSTENLLEVQCQSTPRRIKKTNKIQSPTEQSAVSSQASSSKISDIFVVKQNVEPAKRQFKPIPAPRKIKVLKKTETSLSPESGKTIKKLSETIDTVSGDAQSIFSLKSDTLSYKERLRNRFLAVKKQAKKSVIQVQDDRRGARRKKKKSLDSTDSIFENEDTIINLELDKYEKNKSRWSNEEFSADDFFCGVDEKEPDNNEAANLLKHKIKNKSVEESEKDSIEDENDSNKHSLNEFVNIDNLDTDIIQYLPTEIVDISFYEKLIFKSYKRNSVKFKSKNVDPDFEPRYLEEEGIFKGDGPYIPKAQLTALQDRLSLEENREWFGPDGKLNMLPDPRLDKWFKPFQSDMKTSDFLHEYSPPTLYEPMENIIDTSDNTLEIILHNLTLKHHPLFTKEHVIAQKLFTLFESYQKTISVNAYFIYNKKLEALRAAKERLAKQLQAAGDVNDVQTTRYRKYVTEIKETREKMYIAGKNERQLKKSILLVWKVLKNIRKTQKYSNTNVKLIINRENVDYEHETKVWEQNISEEVSEILQEYETNFYNETQQYKEELKEWKVLKKQLNNSDEQGDIEEILPEKPYKPKRNFNVDEIKFEITEKCNECLKPPGEPLIVFELSSQNEIADEINLPKEKLRRNILRTTQIFIKILYNKREVCKSKYIILDNNFMCNFNEQISVQILKGPHSLNLEIFEQSSAISRRVLAEMNLDIPKFNSISNAEIMTQTFMKKDIITYDHTAVGTGIKINDVIKTNDLDLVENEEQLFCNGILSYSIGWAKESTLPSVPQHIPSTRQIHPKNVDLDSLEEWIKTNPDPQDPQNAILFDYIKNIDMNIDEDKDYFRLDPGMEPFIFCDDDEVDNNLRFRLLQLRDNNEPEFKGLVVPNRIKEIPPDIFENYEKRMREERISSDNLNGQFEDNIDAQRKWANQYLEQAENRIIQLSKIAERRITLRDVINEEIIPSIGSLGLTFMNWLQPKRPLRPARKPVKPIQAAVTFKEMKIMANIIGAIQVPTRKESETASTSKSDQIAVISVRPFVVVSFQGITVRTTVAEGPNPIWNQEFILPLRNTNANLTASSLQNIKDSLVFNLYDETVDDLIVDDRIRDTNIHQQLGCNWLGRIEIPFTTLLYNNRVEGSFKINLPPILLGYERQSIKAFQASGEPFTQKIDTFLTVFITLQPAFGNLQQHIKNELECNEVKYVEEFITNWQTQFNELYPQRQFSSFVTNINGERGCITRYVKPIKLPQVTSSDVSDITELQCAKYVSLIPFRENSAAGLIPDIWLTAEQVLTLMMGSIKDHAVLFTCYLMTLGIKSWLLLGYGMPYGYTAYVLTRETNSVGYDYYIYDVKTAQKYNVYDNICPLQKVFCVINDENIWGNIQDEERLHLTKFDFTKSSDWLQLFGREVSAPISNFQHSNTLYHEPPAVLLLQERIERKLRKKILKWRKYSLTTWNRYCSVILKRLLPKLEECSMQQNDFNSAEHLAELQNLLSTYQIRGFAINFPYTRIAKIIDFIEETGIHLNENPNLEFSLGVYVKSYVNNAVVIWLYLVTLVRRK